MKNILLLGDSIRCGASSIKPGYDGFVKEKLSGIANVYFPDDNCRFAQYTLRYLGDWAKKLDAEKIDVIHWNNGLWDVLRLHGDEPLTPCDMYIEMLRRVHGKLRLLFPNAKIIFALTTSVWEEWDAAEQVRHNSEIEEYNAAAKNLMSSLGVEVNDLYSITRSFSNKLRIDDVHFSEEGSRLLADAVVEKIMSI